MNLIDFVVTKVIGEPERITPVWLNGGELWIVSVAYRDMGSDNPQTKKLSFKTEEEAKAVKEGCRGLH